MPRHRRSLSQRVAAPFSAMLLAAPFVVAAALAYSFHEVTESEQLMISRTSSAYAAFAAAELSRETERLVEAEGRRVLLPIAAQSASADAPPASPSAILAAAGGRSSPTDAVGLLEPWLAFRLELGSGSLATATGSARGRGAATARWVAQVVRGTLAQQRMHGDSEHGTRIVAADGQLLALATIPGADGQVRAVVGTVSDADSVVSRLAGHVMLHHALLPLTPLDGTYNAASIRIAVRTTGGRAVFRTAPADPAERPVELAMPGALAQYTVRASLAPGFALQLAQGSWTWKQAQVATVLLALCSSLILLAMWQMRRYRALTQLRGDFVASVSHELRTPLAHIRMFADMLRLGWVRSDDERAHAIAIIDREAGRLTNLVENVLQFSTRDHQPRRIVARPLALATLIDELVLGFELQLAIHGSRLRSLVDRDLVVNADADALRQILLNLLDNALKYGPPGQMVTIGAEGTRTDGGDAAGVRLWVQDEGGGVPYAERRSIFEPYRRRRHDVDAGTTGSGIGLAVVRDLVRAHGGAVWVERGDGGGARFVATFPPPPRTTAPPSPEAGTVTGIEPTVAVGGLPDPARGWHPDAARGWHPDAEDRHPSGPISIPAGTGYLRPPFLEPSPTEEHEPCAASAPSGQGAIDHPDPTPPP